MPRTNLWDRSVPRVEVDRRSREARLRFERIDQLFIVRATVTPSRLRRLLYLFTVGRYGAWPGACEPQTHAAELAAAVEDGESQCAPALGLVGEHELVDRDRG